MGDISNDISRQYQRQQQVLKAQREYTRIHHIFGHLRKELIRKLFKTTNLPKAIQRNSELCDIYDIAKIKKNRNHAVSKRKKELLDEIIFNTYKKLLKGLFSQVFFLLVIDNYLYFMTAFSGTGKDKYTKELNI